MGLRNRTYFNGLVSWAGLLILCVPNAQADTIYLCKAYNGSTFWAKAHCNQHNALIERIVSVPDGMPFEQQVEGARAGVNSAQARQQSEENHAQRNQRCAQLQRERNQIDGRYTNWQWQPPEVINPDQQRYRAIRSELQRLGCSMQ